MIVCIKTELSQSKQVLIIIMDLFQDIAPKINKTQSFYASNSDIFKDQKCFANQQPIKLPAELLNKPPHNLIGAILYQNKLGIVGLGTGILISPDLVLTSAHNFYCHSPVQTYQNVRFYIKQHGHLETYVEGLKWYIPKEFIEKNTSTTDYALLRLAKPIPTENFVPLEFVDHIENDEKIGIFGYLGKELKSSDPYDPYELHLYQWGLTGKYTMIEFFRKEKKDILYKLSTFPGQSGAPFLLIGKDRTFKIIGIHKGGVTVKEKDGQLYNVSRHLTPQLIQQLKEQTKELGAIPYWKEEKKKQPHLTSQLIEQLKVQTKELGAIPYWKEEKKKSPQKVEFTVKAFNGESYRMNFLKTARFNDITQKIESLSNNLKAENIRLVFAGKEIPWKLGTNPTIEQIRIEKGNVLFMVIKLSKGI